MKLFTDKLPGVLTRQKGLTLFELLIVLAILALLATLIAPRMIGYLGRAKSDVARSQLANIATSMELFYFDVGRYPTTEESLAVLVSAADLPGWRGPYFKEAQGLLDPWGRAYGFTIEAGNQDDFTVFTLGRDGEPGGEGEDADIAKK